MVFKQYRQCNFCKKEIYKGDKYYQIYTRKYGIAGVVSANKDLCQKCLDKLKK